MDPVYVSFAEEPKIRFASSYTLALDPLTLLKPPHKIETVALSYKNTADAECDFIFKVEKINDCFTLNIEFLENRDASSLCKKVLIYGIYSKAYNLITTLPIVQITENIPPQLSERITLAYVSTFEDYIYKYESPLLLRIIICDPVFVIESLAGKVIDENRSDCPTETESKLVCTNNCNFVKDISYFYNTDSMSDVIISTKDKKLNAHKCVLAARSSVFKELLKKSQEKNDNGQDVIAIAADDSIVVEEMLRFIYTGQVEKLDEIVVDLYEIGNKYNLQDLQETCVFHMNKNICIQNAMSLLLLARRYDIDILQKTLIEFFVKHTDEILKDDATSESLKPFFNIELSSSNFDL